MEQFLEKKVKVVKDLQESWTWPIIAEDKHFRGLIYTTNHWYRRDMKTTQRVGKGKNAIKFQYQNKLHYERPHRFVIEAGVPDLRLTWVTEQCEDYMSSVEYFWIHGKTCQDCRLDPWEVEEILTEDNAEQRKYLKVIRPEFTPQALDLLTKFRYGLDNIHDTLRARFA